MYDSPFFWKKKFPLRLRKWTKNRSKKRVFLNLMKKLVINFHWIYSIMKIFIICCVPAWILYFGKILFLNYRPKCSQSIQLQDFKMNSFSRANWWNSLIFSRLIQMHKNEKFIDFFLVRHGQKWLWPIWSQDFKIDFFLGMNWWN